MFFGCEFNPILSFLNILNIFKTGKPIKVDDEENANSLEKDIIKYTREINIYLAKIKVLNKSENE